MATRSSILASDPRINCLALGFPRGSVVKNLPAKRETWVQSPGWHDPSGEGKGYPLQDSGLKNPMDCIVHGIAESQTRLSHFHFTWFYFRSCVPHSSYSSADPFMSLLLPPPQNRL